MSLNWDKIRIFHAVAEAKSLTGASDILNLSQSALSRQITSLEQQLGVPLFHRHARGLTLTEQGDILYIKTKDIYRNLDAIQTQIQDSHNNAAGSLKITAPRFLGGSWLMRHVNAFQDAHPDLRLNFILTNRLLDLSARDADIALRFFEPDQPSLIKRKLAEFQFYLCASKDYLDTHGIPRTPKDLTKHRLIGYPNETNYPHQHTDWIFNLAAIDKYTYDKALLINSMWGIAELVNTHTGIACLPEFIINDYPHIQIIMTDYAPPPSDLFFVYPEQRRNSKRIAVFRDFILDVVRSDN